MGVTAFKDRFGGFLRLKDTEKQPGNAAAAGGNVTAERL